MSRKIGVLIPYYGNKSYLNIERCLNSLAQQTYQDFTVCILQDYDDVPAEGPQKLYALADLLQLKVNVVSAVVKSIAQARQLLLDCYADEFDYLAWQDADDESTPTRLAEQVDFLDHNRIILMVGTGMLEVVEANDIQIKKGEYHQRNNITPPKEPYKIRAAYASGIQGVSNATAMFSPHIATRIKYRTDLPIGEDFVFNLEVQKAFPFTQANIEKPLYIYHRHPASLVRAYRARERKGEVQNILEHMKDCVKKYGWNDAAA